jgi:hypothetical protein
MGFSRSRRPMLPLAVWAMTAALAYAAGRHQSTSAKAGRPKTMKRRARRRAQH